MNKSTLNSYSTVWWFARAPVLYPSRLLRKTNIKLGNKGPVLHIIRNWGMSACIIKDVYCETFFKTFLKRVGHRLVLLGQPFFALNQKIYCSGWVFFFGLSGWSNFAMWRRLCMLLLTNNHLERVICYFWKVNFVLHFALY